MQRTQWSRVFNPMLIVLLLVTTFLVAPATGGASSQISGQPTLRAAADNGDDGPPAPINRTKGYRQPTQDDPNARDDWFYSRRTAGDPDFSVAQAAEKRAEAAQQFSVMQRTIGPAAPSAFDGAWTNVGPDPIVQVGRSGPGYFLGMSGRIGALAIRSSEPYTIYLGAAQGGVWISSTLTTAWTPKTDDLPSLAIGALALAPSNEDIVYVGTGEGALSGDSYYGNGLLKSTDAGNSFFQVSGAAFNQVSISNVAVDPTNADHLFVSTLRGRGGNRRVSPPNPTPFGIWESSDGGITWTDRYTTTVASRGATALVMDPQNAAVLYATYWNQGIMKSTDGGMSWFEAMNGLPSNANYPAAATRFALAISHPAGQASATLYTGFEWVDTDGNSHPSTVWKSTDDANTWSETSTAVVAGYCGSQCFYDNVLAADPTNADIVYAGGMFDYGSGTGGIYRSMDGGATWLDMGWNQHPDFHAIAIRNDAPNNVVIGNDGGVWSSANYGGRTNPGDPIDAADWANLNGTVDPNTAGVTARTGLAIGQFTSVAQHPTNVNRFYGGTQDNGTMRKSGVSNSWFDFAGGDGGQVIVDPNDPNYVYGTYYGISPYRFSDGMLGSFFSNMSIANGINTNDRSEFYVPMAMDPQFTERLYLGTYRLYRTDNRGDLWTTASGDLTSGCSGAAPNGARGCVISAIGPTAGSPAVYVGALDGYINLSTDATAAAPVWERVDKAPLPARPVTSFAVDNSNYRVAYAAFAGFSAATPATPGHVFKTTDAGATWTDISSNLPDIPVNSIIQDAGHAGTLYVGTDIGPLMTTDDGASWLPMGAGFPVVAIWQLNLNTATRQIVAGTHGRGVWKLADADPRPALQVRAFTSDQPVGPGSLLTFNLKIKNGGNAAATGVQVSNPVPANTTFVGADNGGALAGDMVVWSGLAVDAGTTLELSFTVQIAGGLTTGDVITNDGTVVTSAEGVGATGSPSTVVMSPAYDVSAVADHTLDGGGPSAVVRYMITVRNTGYSEDTYYLKAAKEYWPTTVWNGDFSSQIAYLGPLAPGASAQVGVQVRVPATATNGLEDITYFKAISLAEHNVQARLELRTIAVTSDILVVDGDTGAIDVESFYTDALTAAGYSFNYWDLAADPNIPSGYLNAHRAVVWFTGVAYPGPLVSYESQLASFLDNGGNLFLSGMDILDQAAGTTDFVHDYLHIAWDGSEIQNDVPMTVASAVAGNPVTGGMGDVPVNNAAVGYSDYNDQVTPVEPAMAAFLDDTGEPTALTVGDNGYRVVFLGFPFEAFGDATQRADLMGRAMNYFLPPPMNYQLTLQNGLDGYAGASDTFINAWMPTTNYGSGANLYVRQPNTKSILIRFDLAGISRRATITSARIGIWVTYVSDSVHDYSPVMLNVYEMYRPWTEAGATWNEADAGMGWEAPGARGRSDRAHLPAVQQTGYRRTGQWMWFDIAPLVQQWITDPGGNNGLIITANGDVNAEIEYIASDFADTTVRPQMRMTYTAP